MVVRTCPASVPTHSSVMASASSASFFSVSIHVINVCWKYGVFFISLAYSCAVRDTGPPLSGSKIKSKDRADKVTPASRALVKRAMAVYTSVVSFFKSFHTAVSASEMSIAGQVHYNKT